jgi:hypothetical protein
MGYRGINYYSNSPLQYKLLWPIELSHVGCTHDSGLDEAPSQRPRSIFGTTEQVQHDAWSLGTKRIRICKLYNELSCPPERDCSCKSESPNTSEPADRKSDDLRTNASEEVLNFYTIAKGVERICNTQLFSPQLTAMIPRRSSCFAHFPQGGLLERRPSTAR